MRKQFRLFYLALFLFLCLPTLRAIVTLPSIFSDNLVLQQNTRVNIWGKASAGEKIYLKTSWSPKFILVIADNNGKWKIKVKTPRASKNQTISIKGENSLLIKNILIGEVWLCTGQSNMEFPVAKDKGWRNGMLNELEEMKDAEYPDIRLFQVEHQLAPDGEMEDCEGKWLTCNKENLYLAAETATDTYKDIRFTSDHMAVLGAVGILPCASWFAPIT